MTTPTTAGKLREESVERFFSQKRNSDSALK